MKLIIIILIASLMQVSAGGFAQKITLNESGISIPEAFKKIRSQTGFDFVFDSRLIGESRKISLNLNNVDINDALSAILKGQNLSFVIKDKVIVLDKKNSSFLENLISNFDEIDIRGRVLDDKGIPLPGATVSVKGKNRSTVSDSEGRFTLSNIDRESIILVSFIGYETVETKASAFSANASGLTISLKVKMGTLDDVLIVNTGYQKINKGNLTGSVVTINSQELEKRNAVNILQNLEGVVPGLQQYRGVSTIRGVSTFQANTNILVVVDGLPIEGSIADVNPYDVESVSVLKDAAAAAIYGARASNGVIVVTTKRGREKGKTSVEFNTNLTYTNKPDYSYLNYMSPSEQVDWESKYYNWYFNGGGGTVPNPINSMESDIAQGRAIGPVQYGYYQLKKGQINQSQLDAQLNGLRGNDFASEFRDQALLGRAVQQYNLALRTSNEKSQNSLVVNYTTDNTGIINAYNRKINLFYKGTYNVAKWLDLDYGVNSVIGKARSHNSRLAVTPFNVPSYYRLLNPDGSRAYYSTSQFNQYNTLTETVPQLYSAKFNHLDELERDFVKTSVLNTRYYVNLNFKVLKGLTINPMFQYEDNRTNTSGYSEENSYTMRWLQNVYTTRTGTAPNYTYTNLLPKGGKLATSQLRSPNSTARLQANFDREFGKHGFIAIAGTEFRQTRTFGEKGSLLGYDEQLQTQLTNFVNFNSLYAINTGTFWNTQYPVRQNHFLEIGDLNLIRDEMHRFASGYANLTYTYDKKYNLFGSVRKDYADLFGGDEKYRGRPLWSVGASWLASNEDFIKQFEFLDYLKVRGSYGLTGNIRNVTAVLAATTSTNPITQLPNASISNPPNPQLRWEKTATTNVGVDFAFLQNRLRGTLDWYRRKGTDLFAQKRLDPSEGFTSMVINNASMLNHGVELNLAYDWFRATKSGGFNWSTNISGATNKNKITDVDELTRNPISLAAGEQYRVGYPVRSIFSFQFAGLNATGIPQWYNTAGLPVTTVLGPNDAEALAFSGSSDPRFNLSLNNDFSYKGFSLSVFAVYYGGHYYRARPVPVPYQSTNYASLPSYLLNSWTPTNTNTDIPGSGQYYQLPITNQYYYSDNLVRKADFIKIRNIVLGYDIPKSIASRIKATNLKLRFQVNDPKALWTRQNDVHVDPETGGMPIPTSYVFGINANF